MGKVGIAPGTVTLTVGPDGTIDLVGAQQDPGSIIRRQGGGFVGAELGRQVPTDFDLWRIYGYLPVQSGWIAGKVSKAPLSGGCCGFGQDEVPAVERRKLETDQRKALIATIAGATLLGAIGGALLAARGALAAGAGAGAGAAAGAFVGRFVGERFKREVIF